MADKALSKDLRPRRRLAQRRVRSEGFNSLLVEEELREAPLPPQSRVLR